MQTRTLLASARVLASLVVTALLGGMISSCESSMACNRDADCGGALICAEGTCLATSSSPDPSAPIVVPDAGGPADPTPDAAAAASADAAPDAAASVPFLPPARCTTEDPVEACTYTGTLYGLVNGRCAIIEGCRSPRIPGNRFALLEECLKVCEGRPLARPCPAGTERRTICTDCGAAGGCGFGQPADVCAVQCTDSSQCDGARGCIDGVCQANGCV